MTTINIYLTFFFLKRTKIRSSLGNFSRNYSKEHVILIIQVSSHLSFCFFVFCFAIIETTCLVLSGLVHTRPGKFENAALFLRLGLPSTLIRHLHKNGALFLRLGLPSTLIRHLHKNGASFLPLGQPSTLIRHVH